MSEIKTYVVCKIKYNSYMGYELYDDKGAIFLFNDKYFVKNADVVKIELDDTGSYTRIWVNDVQVTENHSA